MSIDESSLLLAHVQRRQQGGSVDVRRTGDFDDQVRRDSQMAHERMPELVGQWVRDDQIDVVSRQPENRSTGSPWPSRRRPRRCTSSSVRHGDRGGRR